jgi:hypothetical protein
MEWVRTRGLAAQPVSRMARSNRFDLLVLDLEAAGYARH